MQFPSREIEDHAVPVRRESLRVGETYFSVQYLDDALTVPHIETLVFIGRDLLPGDASVFYFQNAESHRKGVPFEESAKNCNVYAQKDINHIFEFERALEALMLCSLRRRGG